MFMFVVHSMYLCVQVKGCGKSASVKYMLNLLDFALDLTGPLNVMFDALVPLMKVIYTYMFDMTVHASMHWEL